MMPSPATVLLFLLGSTTLATTLAQCGDGRAASGPIAAPRAVDSLQDRQQSQTPADSIQLLVSGAMLGRLEPCGCASGQLGGLARRMQHIGEQRNYDLLIEGGNLVDTATELDLLKLLTANQVLFGMPTHRYDVLGVGAHDLALPRTEWAAFLEGSPVVASNLICREPPWPARPFVEKDVRGRKVRIASFLCTLPEPLRAPESPIQQMPTAAAWEAALAGADADTRRIVLAHGTDTEIRSLIPQLSPAPDLVIGVDDGYIEPTSTATSVGGVPLVFSGIRGRVLLAIALSRTASGPRAICELVPLSGSKTVPGGGGDPDVRDVILAHRHDVKNDNVLAKMARQLPTSNGAAYVGSEACKTCHPQAFEAWAKSKHAQAWETLEAAEKDPKRYGWPVTAYPDCVGCHVVGHRQQTGFLSHADTPQLTDVGCERCHGAGSDHMATNGQKKLGLIGDVAPSLLCVQCHDFEQSPSFVYGERWLLIQHGREKK